MARLIGIGVNNYEPFNDVLNYIKASSNKEMKLSFDCGVLAGRYTLLEQAALSTLNRAYKMNVKI